MSNYKFRLYIDQKMAVDLGLVGKVDLVDLAILDVVATFIDSGRGERLLDSDGGAWHWIDYNLVIKDLPLAGITRKEVVARRVKKLAEAGLVDLHPNNQKLCRSYMRLTEKYTRHVVDQPLTQKSDLLLKSKTPLTEKSDPSYSKVRGPLTEKSDDYNTINYSTNYSTKQIDTRIDEVVNFLNEKTGRSYRPSTKATRRLISAVLKEFTVDDCKMVIEHRVADWIGNRYAQYLRPSTLFNKTKFEEYFQAADAWAKQGRPDLSPHKSRHNGAKRSNFDEAEKRALAGVLTSGR